MPRMNKFLAVHRNPGLDCKVIQENWRKLANANSANWERTYFNEEKGIRYCVWLSPNEEELKKIFDSMDITYESILPVEETVPDLWGQKWDEHLQKDAAADNLGV